MSSSVIAAPSSNNAASSTAAPTSETPTDTPSESSSDASTSTSTSASASATPTTSSSSPTSESSSPSPTSTSASDTASSTSATSSSEVVSSSVVSETSSNGSTNEPTTILITSTEALPSQTAGSSAGDAGSQSTGGTGADTVDSSNSGLSAGGTIAVAVVVPVVSVAMIVLAALYFFRKWKGKKAAEEERRKEVEEYGFNPNNDPSLPPVGAYDPQPSPQQPSDDVSGYRGWGTTSAGRKASTNLSSGAGVGLAMSEVSSNTPGYHHPQQHHTHHAATPSEGTIQYSDGTGAGPTPAGGEDETIGVLGAAPVAANNRASDIRRGPSNASSAYSAANHSEASDESHMSATHPTAPFYEDNPYYNDSHTAYGGGGGAYGEGPYNPPGQPVIRDVQARRNTRIENPAVFPRQGNAGIAQNF